MLTTGKGTHYCAYCGYDMKAKEERLCVDCDGDTCTPKKRASKPKISPIARWKAHAFLAPEELPAVHAAKNRRDLFIGGFIENRKVVLYRGNLELVVVPFDWFKPSGKGVRPDFSRFAVTDFGQTVKFGEYEAATHAVLYDFDPDYQERSKTSKKVKKLSNPTIAPLAELDRWKKAHALLWLRLSWARGALYQLKPTKEREAVLRETRTNDAPSDEMIDWAKSHVLKEQERHEKSGRPDRAR